MHPTTLPNAGGPLLIAGLATPLAGVALAGDMFVALVTDHIHHGFFADGGIELVLLLGGASAVLALTGAGHFSAGHILTRQLTRHSPGRDPVRSDAKVTT